MSLILPSIVVTLLLSEVDYNEANKNKKQPESSLTRAILGMLYVLPWAIFFTVVIAFSIIYAAQVIYEFFQTLLTS